MTEQLVLDLVNDDFHISQLSPEHVVTQSNDLIMSKQNLSLQERRIIYAFASLINNEDEDFKTHRIKVRDIAQILDIQEKNYYKKVQEIVLGLQSKGVYIQKNNSELYINWIASSEYFHGQGFVELEFSKKMKPYLLQLKEQFTPFKLRNILSLRSGYSMRIYELLKKEEYRKKAKYSITNLRHLIGLPDDKYERYTHFKNRIILSSQKELEAQTDISFDFREIKEGRRVVALDFIIKKNNSYVEKIINNSDLDEAMILLTTYKINKNQAVQLLKDYGKNQVIRNIEYIESQNKKYNNISGAIVSAIKNDYASNNDKPSEDFLIDEIVQETIKYYRNDNGPIPEWLIKDFFEKKAATKLDLNQDQINSAWEQWSPTILRLVK